MKRNGLVIGLGSVSALAIMVFVVYELTCGTLFQSKNDQEKEWSLLKIENFQIMSVNPDESWFSDIKKAYLVKNIEDGNLPISMSISFANSKKKECKDIKCKVVYQGVSIESVLTSCDRQENDTTAIYSGLFKYDLSELKKIPAEDLVTELARFVPGQAKIYIKPESDSHKETDWIALN